MDGILLQEFPFRTRELPYVAAEFNRYRRDKLIIVQAYMHVRTSPRRGSAGNRRKMAASAEENILHRFGGAAAAGLTL